MAGEEITTGILSDEEAKTNEGIFSHVMEEGYEEEKRAEEDSNEQGVHLVADELALMSTVEEFLGSSLSGRSIYGPPRVKRISENDNDNDEDEAATTTPPTSTPPGDDDHIPDWKRKIVEKKREEQERIQKERELWEKIPEWKRKLLEGKISREKVEERPETSPGPIPMGSPPRIVSPMNSARFWGVTLKKTQPEEDPYEEHEGDDDYVSPGLGGGVTANNNNDGVVVGESDEEQDGEQDEDA